MAARKTKWIVGRLHDPRPDDLLRPYFTIEAAELHAEQLAKLEEKDVIAIWDNEDDVEYVFTGGMKLIQV